MSGRVFRVQDADGRGPFKPGFSRLWADEDFAPGMKPLPTMMEEFGWGLIEREGRPGEHFGTAVRSVEKLGAWFPQSEQRKLKSLGFNIVSLVPGRVIAESENQLIFARKAPLRCGVIVIPWRVAA